jgi:mRNA interferase RelE/StbE
VSPAPLLEILWTQTALQMLAAIGDRRIQQQQIFDASKRLEIDPEKQGKPLRENLIGFRSLRVIGQRYRLIYSVAADARTVHVVATGLRREDSRNDVYELAQKIVRLGLAPSAKKRKRADGSGRPRKKK